MFRKRHTYRTRQAVRILISAAIACILAVTAVMPVSAETARATTMKLEKTEGTVTLKTQNGTARKITTGMRLYSGNTLATAASSYAFVSLDSSKAVKLDEKTSTTLRQSGKELELLVRSGKLFFNVSSPLTEKEDMNIRTSSMVTGIRGTCGVVEYVNPSKSRLYLLEGTVTLGYGDNATTIHGGQTATVILQKKDEAGSGDNGNTAKDVEQKVYVEKLTEADVPLFAIVEILKDPVLQKKIEETTDLEIKKFEEVLNPSPQEPDEGEETKPGDTTTPGGGSGGSSGGGGSTVPSAPEPTGTTLSGDQVTADEIHTAFGNYDTVTLTGAISAIDKLDIPANRTLVVETALSVAESVESDDPTPGKITVVSGGKLVIGENGSLINDGELINNGTLTNNGKLENRNTFTNSGTLDNIGTFTNSVILENTGTINNSGAITNDGTITDTGKGIILGDGSTLTNNNSITGNITLTENSELINNQNGTITGGITLKDGSTFTNTGMMTATSSWSVNNATVNNTGTIDMGINAISVTGNLNLSSVGTITGNGAAVISLTGGGTLTLGSDSSSGGSISNTSTDSNHYAIAVGDGSTITWIGRYVEILTGSTAEIPIGNTIQGLTLANGTITDSKGILKGSASNLTWVEASKKLCYQL